MGGLAATQEFARLFMAPGVLHSEPGAGLEPQNPFDALVVTTGRTKLNDITVLEMLKEGVTIYRSPR
jgi:hypothetical protein